MSNVRFYHIIWLFLQRTRVEKGVREKNMIPQDISHWESYLSISIRFTYNLKRTVQFSMYVQCTDRRPAAAVHSCRREKDHQIKKSGLTFGLMSWAPISWRRNQTSDKMTRDWHCCRRCAHLGPRNNLINFSVCGKNVAAAEGPQQTPKREKDATACHLLFSPSSMHCRRIIIAAATQLAKIQHMIALHHPQTSS